MQVQEDQILFKFLEKLAKMAIIRGFID